MRIGPSYGSLAGDALVHVEQVAVLLADGVLAVAGDGIGEVEVHAVLEWPDAEPLVDHGLGVAGRDVARDQVAEGRVLLFEVVVALGVGDVAADRASSWPRGTQMRPSLRSDSDMSVSLLWNSSLAGMQVGWIWV